MQAQFRMTWSDFVDAISDDDYAEQQEWTESMEELALLAAHPMDVNTATREQLRQLPFLTDEQIEGIHEYIFLHRGMHSLSELMAIPSIDYRTRQFLSVFLIATETPFERKDTFRLKTLFAHAHHELSTRFDVPLYYRLGYSYPPHQGGYQGTAFYHNVRYQLESKNHLSLGVTAEKDQGEPFRGNHGWDSYGAYLMIRNIGHLRSAIVGDYKMGFGEGLVVNTGFSTGKSTLMKRPSQGLRAKRGMDEVNYFCGAAATIGFRHMEMTSWLSFRPLDASLNGDGSVKTLQTSGQHRTEKELSQKGNTGSLLTGGNLSWRNNGFHLGATGYFQRFHKSLSPGTALYRRIYPVGKYFGVVGANYGYTHLWFSVTGETAYSTERGGWATLNRASWKISPNYTLSTSYRFYSYKYHSFYASALSENSNVQNESGATLRLDATPVENLTLTGYLDYFYNPWPRYTLTHSSQGQEAVLMAEYTFRRKNSIALRYQFKRKERSNRMQQHNRIRLQYNRTQGTNWQLQSMLNLHVLEGRALGYALSQRVRYKHEWLQTSAMLTYFHTPDYDTRIFLYEPLLSNMFRYPSLYGRGFRWVLAAHGDFWHKKLRAELLYGATRYTDRQTQGSGMQEIRSPWKQDISIQLRLRI